MTDHKNELGGAVAELASIAGLASTADVWFLDIWGVLHNGVRPFAPAVLACQTFRGAGGKVVLVSNSPRPRAGVIRQLNDIGVDATAYDDVITSGDVARGLIGALGKAAILHIGPARDAAIFDGLEAVRVATDDAQAIACTGLFDDERETPDDYAQSLTRFRARGLPMICANPDLTVERGQRIIYCAGAIAAAYEALGGSVAYAGKPHAPIYDSALAIASHLRGFTVEKARILAIGDGARTDIAGALRFGIRAVFVASGVSVAHGEPLDAAARRLFPDAAARPVAVMSALTW